MSVGVVVTVVKPTVLVWFLLCYLQCWIGELLVLALVVVVVCLSFAVTAHVSGFVVVPWCLSWINFGWFGGLLLMALFAVVVWCGFVVAAQVLMRFGVDVLVLLGLCFGIVAAIATCAQRVLLLLVPSLIDVLVFSCLMSFGLLLISVCFVSVLFVFNVASR
ncbi:hypothetical protein U1Q18_007019 [Sarracenia purpurea var. burkii]